MLLVLSILLCCDKLRGNKTKVAGEKTFESYRRNEIRYQFKSHETQFQVLHSSGFLLTKVTRLDTCRLRVHDAPSKMTKVNRIKKFASYSHKFRTYQTRSILISSLERNSQQKQPGAEIISAAKSTYI